MRLRWLRTAVSWVVPARVLDARWPDYERRTYLQCWCCREYRPTSEMTWWGDGPVCAHGGCAAARGDESYGDVA